MEVRVQRPELQHHRGNRPRRTCVACARVGPRVECRRARRNALDPEIGKEIRGGARRIEIERAHREHLFGEKAPAKLDVRPRQRFMPRAPQRRDPEQRVERRPRTHASSGLHGANRLASNSLLEGLVYGAIAGRNASNAALLNNDNELRVLSIFNAPQSRHGQPIDLADIRNAVRALMWRNVGVQRRGDRLSEAVHAIQQYCSYVLAQNLSNVDGWELQNILTVSLQMASAALARTESRGVHFRTDYPKVDNFGWQKHLEICRPS